MESSFNPETCRQALKAFLQQSRSIPEVEAVMDSEPIIRLIESIPGRLFANGDETGAGIVDYQKFWWLRYSWFRDECVVGEIVEAITEQPGLADYSDSIGILFGDLHKSQMENAEEVLCVLGKKALVIHFCGVTVGGVKLVGEESAAFTSSVFSEMADDLSTFEMSPEMVNLVKKGELTVAHLLNSEPWLLLLPFPELEIVEAEEEAKENTKEAEKAP